MKRNISDLLDRYPAEDVELGGNTPYSPTRIKEITMKNIHTETKSRKRGFKPARLLVAAAVAAAFTVSALAAGRLLRAVPGLLRRRGRLPLPGPAGRHRPAGTRCR